MYFLIYLIVSVLCTVILSQVFEHQAKFIVFLLFFLYYMSCISFSFLIGAIFSKPKTAVLVGMLVFFVMYFPSFIFSTSTTRGLLTVLSLFNPIAMSRGFYTLLMFEGNQVSIGLSSLDKEFGHYSVETALVMLFTDFVLYLALALYLDKVIPGEYGVSLP